MDLPQEATLFLPMAGNAEQIPRRVFTEDTVYARRTGMRRSHYGEAADCKGTAKAARR